RIRPWPACPARTRPSACRSPAHGRRATPAGDRGLRLLASGLAVLPSPAPPLPNARHVKNRGLSARGPASNLPARYWHAEALAMIIPWCFPCGARGLEPRPPALQIAVSTSGRCSDRPGDLSAVDRDVPLITGVSDAPMFVKSVAVPG